VETPRVEVADPVRKAECEHQLVACTTAVELEKTESKKGDAKEEFDAKTEFAKLTSSRSDRVYTPPVLLRALKASAELDRSSIEH
jgi:hypothetical protein